MNIAAPYTGGNPNAQYLAAFPWIMNQGGGAQSGLKTVGTTAPMNYNAAFGGTPTIPDPASTAGTAVTGNLGNLADIYKLAGSVNTFNQGEAVSPYVANLPNYEEMTRTASGNILGGLKGQLNRDEVANLTQFAAERGIATGTSGAPNMNAALLRLYGLTQRDIENQAQTQLTGAMARTPTGTQLNPASFLVTPEQQQAAAAGQGVYSAAPVPGNVAAANMGALNQGINQGRGPVIPGSAAPSAASAASQGAYYAPPSYSAPTSMYGAQPAYTGPQYGTPGTGEAYSTQVPDLSAEQSSYYEGPDYAALMESLGGGSDYYDEEAY